MADTRHLIADTEGERLDVFLARVMPQQSRVFWQKLCKSGDVLVNTNVAVAKHALKAADTVTIVLPAMPDFSQQTIPVVYEDDDVIVMNKPAGMLTHAKGALSHEFTVAEFVRPRTTDGVDTNRPGIVHRLDRGTSGLIIAAKHNDAKRWLQKQFSERKVKKTYQALVEGHFKEPSAMLDLPIERNPKTPQMFKVSPNGKPAQTTYDIANTFKAHTLVNLHPLTGRTHQLRVHMLYLGHPIVGDPLYGKAEPALGRMFLHAKKLELTLPSRERKVFTAELPYDLQDYLTKMS